MRNLLKRQPLIFVCLFFVMTKPAYAEDLSVSFSPLTLLGILFSYPDNDDIRKNIWVEAEVNFLTDNGKEHGLGFFARSYCYGMRYSYRKYSKDDHSGFLYGLYVRAEYQEAGWSYLEDGEIGINYSLIGNGITGTVYKTAGLTAGGDIGVRFRGEQWGATFFIGIGVPAFFWFGDLPREVDVKDFYLKNALLKMVDAGIRIDFYTQE